jgi:hypothetical protein
VNDPYRSELPTIPLLQGVKRARKKTSWYVTLVFVLAATIAGWTGHAKKDALIHVVRTRLAPHTTDDAIVVARDPSSDVTPFPRSLLAETNGTTAATSSASARSTGASARAGVTRAVRRVHATPTELEPTGVFERALRLR